MHDIWEVKLRERYQLYLIKHHNKATAHNDGSSYHMKDSEKNKTYQCEWNLWKLYPQINAVMSRKDTENYVRRICKSKFWKGYVYTTPRIEWMKDMGGGRRVNAVADRYSIRFSPSGASKYVVLHELAHVAGYMNHGRGFRIMLLKLCSRFLGRDVSKSLKDLFKEKGLKTSKIREPLDYEEWKERYLRLSESRTEFGGGKN